MGQNVKGLDKNIHPDFLRMIEQWKDLDIWIL